MNLAFGSHFKRSERLVGKIICSSLPISLTEEFPDITDQFGCGHKAEFLPSVGGLGGREIFPGEDFQSFGKSSVVIRLVFVLFGWEIARDLPLVIE